MEPISEERCIFSGRWPEKDRWALRDTIEILPLEDDRVCDACFAAFWQKCGVGGPDGPSAIVEDETESSAALNGLRANR